MEDEGRGAKRRKGGNQMRMAAAMRDSGGGEIESLLASYLTYQVVWGIFSPQVAQTIAHLAMQDIEAVKSTGGSPEALQNIAKLGNYGKLPNNVHRDFMTVASKGTEMGNATRVKMPFALGLGEVDQDIMLPHVLFASIYEKFKDSWKKVIVPSDEDLEAFWDAQEDHPNLEDHPLLEREGYKSRCVPIGMHGDEVPVTGKGKVWQGKIMTFEWVSLVGHGTTTEAVLWIWGVFLKAMLQGAGGTLERFMKILKWSFYWLWLGKWPTHDYEGKKYPLSSEEGKKANTWLADGYYAVLWALMGDLDYFYYTLGLPRYSASSPCCLCKCTIHGATTWKDNRKNAPWLQTLWTPSSWLNWEGRTKCEIFTLPGVTATTVALDYMHSKYLGCDQYIFGSVFYLLCFVIMESTPKANLERCWAFIKLYWKNHRVSVKYRYINKLTMFVRKSDFPKLRGKAAEIKHFGPVVLALFTKFMNKNLEIHKTIQTLLKLNVKMEQILESHKEAVALPEQAAMQFKNCAMAMAQMQLKCSEHFLEEPDIKAFNITSKTHMVVHSALLSKYLNPRKVWCFSGEDFMRKVQRLGESCVTGNNAAQASIKMVSHYRVAMHLEFQNHKKK